MLGRNGFHRFWNHRSWRHRWGGHRRRGLLVVVGTVLALSGIAMALFPPSSSQAATGTKWSMGVQHVGYLKTNTTNCTVTVISRWLAITAKHCGWVNPYLKLNVAALSTPGVVPVKKIEVNRDWDVEAIFLMHQTCCVTMTPLRGFITSHDRLSAWGYGTDHSNNEPYRLTRADFDPPKMCHHEVSPDQGSLCWNTTATNSLCRGDSGAPILQNGAIVGMATSVGADETLPNGLVDCRTVYEGQAITIKEIRTWLDQMITDAEPFD